MVPRILPLCWLVLSWTSQHNIVFLEGVKAALTADAAENHGWYNEQPAKGLRSMARVYAGWGFSQALPWYLTCTHPRASLLSKSPLVVTLLPLGGSLGWAWF